MHMESRKMVLMNLFAGQQWRHKENRLLNTGGGGEQGEGATNGESSMETYILPYVKEIANGSLLYDSGNLKQGSVTT